jgi:phage terminase large subunit-like protein
MWYLERPEAWDKDPSMLAMGVDGPALGARADEFVFDDVNDPQNTATEMQRGKVTSIVKAVAFTRQTGKSKFVRMVAVMTRWHDEDLVKTFEEEGFEVIWMPALGYWEYVHNRPLPVGKTRFLLSEVDDYLGEDLAKLEQGSPLWPAEYDRDYFEPFQQNSPDIFLLQFQGLSIRPGGNRFKEEDFRYWGPGTDNQLDPYKVRGVFQFWDTASKAKTQHDWWVCQTWAWAVDGFYLLDVYANKMEFPAGVKAVEQKWRDGASLRAIEGEELVQLAVRMVHVEETGTNNGTAVVQSLLLKRVPIIGIPKGTSKEESVDMALGPFRDKPFFFPMDGARYTGMSREEVIKQHLQFPRGRHDDSVDVTAQAVNYLNTFQVAPPEGWQGKGKVNESLQRGNRARPSLVPSGVSNKLVRGGFGSRVTRRSGRYRDPAIPD